VVASGPSGHFLASIVERSSSQDAMAHNLAVAAERLTASGVPWFLLDAGAMRRPVIGVPQDQAEQALRALAVDGPDLAYWAPRGDASFRPAISGDVPPAVRRSSVITYFVPTATADGILLESAPEACEIEFWRLDGDTLLPPRRNPWCASIPRNRHTDATREWAGRAWPTHQEFLTPRPFSVNFPVDVVYTWVDGDDPVWRAKLDAARGISAPANPLAANDARYTSRDELRYSLRSLERFAGWVRHIYLVTDDQVPEWLDVDHPGVTVISHRELFDPADALPTFNSHAIGTQVRRIPGLSEHFLLFNDDVFLGRPVTPETFFHGNGLTRIFPSPALFGQGPRTADDAPVDAAGKNNRDLIEQRFGARVTNKFLHAPHALRRSVLDEVAEVFDEPVTRTARSRFRDPDDIAMASLTHYYAYFTGRATTGTLAFNYFDLAAENVEQRLQRLSRFRDRDAFCLNDTIDHGPAAQVRHRVLQEFVEGYFPLPSRFEKR
jgi:hypothetical protein